MNDKLGPYTLGHSGIPPDDPHMGIYTGDARELAKAIPDESVDLVFTDPPYPKEHLYLWDILSEISARILKDGGSLLAMSGMQYFEYVFDALRTSLNYHWLNAYYMPTVTHSLRFWPKKIHNMWKPILWFTKGKRTANSFVADGVSNRIQDKRYHEWGQSTAWVYYWLQSFDGIVFDPFTGGGTVPAVCKMLGRKWLAFEIEPATADLARNRVRNTQPPLFVPQPQQTKMAFNDE